MSMKRVSFFPRKNRGNTLHVEVPGAIVNITVNLEDYSGRKRTVVQIIPDNYVGEEWHIPDAGHCLTVPIIEGKEVGDERSE